MATAYLLTDDEVALVLAALDSHEYWQLSEAHERHSGYVVLPEDDPDGGDTFDPDADEDEAHASIRACRALAERFRQARDEEASE